MIPGGAGDQAASRSSPSKASSTSSTVDPRSGPRAAASGVDCTPSELLVICMSREIKDAELVFVGTRLPLVAFMLARRTHAGRAVALFENGILREEMPAELLFTMGDPPNLLQASMLCDMQGVMGLLQQGRVDLGLLGGAQVDRFGNLNSTAVIDAGGRRIRLPGSGGACDIACLARRTVIGLRHERRRLPARVDYLTSPGYGDGGDWRQRVGLRPGGPAAVITDRAVLRFGDDGEAYLASVHPGQDVAEILAGTGWPLRVPAAVPVTAPPTPLEVNVLRELDPQGFWVGGDDDRGGDGGARA